ncbi:MAG: hypothetical protein NWS21_03825, partial [Burkholderiaceae bacterium]|nr:hypothetical protein [Burkholderiaceae bacterium]
MQSKLKSALKLLVVAPVLAVATQAQALTVWVSEFSSASAEVPAPWRVVQIDKRVRPTVYRVREWDGVN